MGLDQREMPVNHANILWKFFDELRQHGRKAAAARSLKVAVLDDGNVGGVRSQYPIRLANWRENGFLSRARCGVAADHRALRVYRERIGRFPFSLRLSGLNTGLGRRWLRSGKGRLRNGCTLARRHQPAQ